MKKVFFILVIACLFMSFLNAADKVKVRQEVQVNDRDPFAGNHPYGTPPTEDLFDWQFEWPVGVGGGEAGIETDGTYMYTTKWNGGTFYRYAMDGTYIEEFSVTGCPGSIRDLAYDGTYFYGAAASNTVYEMDFDTQTVISTITAPIAVRAIAYDEGSDGFWGNNWSDTITLFDRNGTTLDSFPCGTWISYYGFAWEDVLDGGPYLWGYSQAGNGNQLVQIEIATGQETGVNFDIGSIFAVGTGIAGGMCISDAFVPGTWTICGTSQNVIIWGVELAPAAPPESPAAPTDFAVIPDAGGALEAMVAWTCPALQVNGDPLTDLDEMRVYRDDVLIYADTTPVIGGPGFYLDAAVPASGTYTYSAVGFNDFGEGIAASGTTWVGEDVPNVVEDLLLVEQGGNGYLTWTNPTTGLNGGAFNNPILGYHIERSDGVLFEVTGIQTDYLDTTIPAPDYYYYTVTPYNLIGDGGSETSNTEWLGESFSGIVILDLDPTSTGAALQTAIQNNYAGQVVVTSDWNAYPLTSDVEALFILLGIYSSNYVLQEAEVLPATNYLDGGGCVYMEGGDTWAYDTQTSLHGYFNLNGLLDGSSDLSTVTGADFLSGMTWSYSGENNYIDHLGPIAPAVTIFSNTAIGYDCGIAYDSGTYNTVGTSFEITGLGGTNTLEDAVVGILDFFDVGSGPNPFDPPENVAVDPYNGIVTWDPPGGTIIQENFDSYNVGDYLCVVAPDLWATWSGTPGGAEDVLISDDQSISPSNSIIVELNQDIVLVMDDYTSGVYAIELNMYVPTGYCGYFNLQKTSTPGTEWAFQIYYQTDGTALADAGGAGALTHPFNHDEWMELIVVVDLDSDWATYYFNGVEMIGYQWTLGTFGTPGLLQFGGVNIFGGANSATTDTPLFYVDDVSLSLANAEPSDELTGYNVYLDDILQDYTTELTYQYTGLVPDTDYVAGVSAVYDDPGESDIVEVPFTFLSSPTYPPINFTATLADYNDVYLEWEQPAGTGGVLAYHSGYDLNGIGTGAAADFMCAARFTADELATYYGSALTSVNVHIRTADFSYVAVKVWEGGSFGNAGTEIYSADITGSVLIEDWTEHTLTTPIPLVSGNEYWIGYDMSATGDHPASVDAGPAVAGKGDWMYYTGIWQEISVAFALDYNWCIEGVVGGDADGLLTSKPVLQKSRQMVSNGTPEVLYTNTRTKRIENNRDSRMLLGYKVYRNGTEIAEILDPNQLTYDDLALDAGTYEYWATAIYDEGESDPSNAEEVTVNLYAPLDLTAIVQGINNVFASWDAPGPGGGGLYELSQHDGIPNNAYYQAYGSGYGVVYDVSGYTDVTVEMVDFRHSPWGIFGTWDYNIHIVDWDTYTEIGTINGLQTTGDDIWEEEIDLGSLSASGLVGIFIEPLSNDPADAYPCIDGDAATGGTSYYGDLSNYSAFGLSTVGDFLMDLWIMGNQTDEIVKAPRFKVNYGEGEARIQTNNTPVEFIELSQTVISRELDFYNVYRNGDWIDDVTSTFYLDVGVPSGTHTYNVTAVYAGGWESSFSNDATVTLDAGNSPVPLVTELNGNYPNPFNPETAIKFAINEAGKVRIDIFNIKGQYVKTLVNEHLEAANHSVIWDGKDDNGVSVSSGVYFYKMDAAKYTSTKKMILMK